MGNTCPFTEVGFVGSIPTETKQEPPYCELHICPQHSAAPNKSQPAQYSVSMGAIGVEQPPQTGFPTQNRYDYCYNIRLRVGIFF